VFTANKCGSSGGAGVDASVTTGNISFIANNTFYQNTTTGTGALRLTGGGGAIGVYNNLSWANTASGTTDIQNATTGGIATLSNNYSTPDPLFFNPSNPVGADNIWGTSDDGLQLTACSQAINTGTNTPIASFPTDAIGGARIQQTTVDPGAYESPYVYGAVTPSVVLSVTPLGAICSGTSVTFTATPTNGGATPQYQWLKNGVVVLAGGSPTYTDATLTNNATIQVKLISSALCRTLDTAVSNTITMVVNPTPAISGTSFTNPTTCGGADGTISLSGLTPASGYSVNYSLNGVAQPPVAISANGTGVVVITGLGAGSYTNLSVSTSAPCSSNVVAGPIVLVPPASPSISGTTSTDPTTCGGSDGTISLSGLSAGLAYTVNYSKNGTPQTATITASGSGVVVISGLTVGSYTNISVSRLSCSSNTITGPIVLNPPPSPVITTTASSDPLTCAGTSGTITLNGLNATTAYSVSYTKNTTTPTTVTITSNASGSVIITGLSQGSYTNI